MQFVINGFISSYFSGISSISKDPEAPPIYPFIIKQQPPVPLSPLSSPDKTCTIPVISSFYGAYPKARCFYLLPHNSWHHKPSLPHRHSIMSFPRPSTANSISGTPWTPATHSIPEIVLPELLPTVLILKRKCGDLPDILSSISAFSTCFRNKEP